MRRRPGIQVHHVDVVYLDPGSAFGRPGRRESGWQQGGTRIADPRPHPEKNDVMDKIDRAILRIVQADATVPIAAIADRVGLSQTPCWKRIRRLETTGIIERRVALLNPEKIGLGITVFVSIQAPDHSEAWLSTFADSVTAMPEVMDFYRMAGDVDYMLRVVVTDMAAYDAFYKRLISAVSLKNVTSRFAMERIKSETAYLIA